MSDDETPRRIDSLETRWSLVANAHELSDEASQRAARQQIVERYRDAIRRYAVAVVRDDDLADDLLQQFVVLVMEGKLHNASPAKGRFRKYLKTIIINLIRTHFREHPTTAPLPEQLPDPKSPHEDSVFSSHWRDGLIEQAFDALEQRSPVQSRLLRMRVAVPEATSSELASQYVSEHNAPMTAVNVRKSLQRAHAAFSQILIECVAATLEVADVEAVEAELKELDLLKYCRSAFESWSQRERR